MAGAVEQSNRPTNIRQPFAVAVGERALLTGRTGTGKSTLARHLLGQSGQILVICDPKGDFDFADCQLITNPDALTSFRRHRKNDGVKRPNRGLIYRPEPPFWKQEYWEAFFQWVYEFRDCCLYVDEIFGVMNNNISPHWLKAVLTRGRSLRITCIACTQRPYTIPVSLLTECEHRFMFALTLLDDKKRMAELMPGIRLDRGKEVPTVLTPLHGPYNFYYYYVRSDNETREFCLQLSGRR